MKRALLALGLFVSAEATGHADPPLLHASVTCAAASKPGRIRCRAVLELPLDRVASARIGWAELRVLGGHPSVTPLRGRLGLLDAETRDDARIVWSFSVAAAASGELPMDVRLVATVEPTGGAPILAEQRITVPIKVAPPDTK